MFQTKARERVLIPACLLRWRYIALTCALFAILLLFLRLKWRTTLKDYLVTFFNSKNGCVCSNAYFVVGVILGHCKSLDAHIAALALSMFLHETAAFTCSSLYVFERPAQPLDTFLKGFFRCTRFLNDEPKTE